ncbi:hypothetical protein BDF20DRAFT_836861 [Mycotypha africana]|uniref:uncharacterized protein n=1 Tax=Mycotypha africana TaxID=64632 RepID=UPI002301A0D2|nr:uncharacterized protein BDF20DRAFT_836861 [Mycotypha africana]KAI8975463.1 hypothetical protein BDF20DRAFT_836861 [Mycotypha africana]
MSLQLPANSLTRKMDQNNEENENHLTAQYSNSLKTQQRNSHYKRKRIYRCHLPAIPLSLPINVCNLVRVVMLVGWLVFCGFVETFLAQLSEIRYENASVMNKHPLPDLLYDAFPKINNMQIVNYLLTTTVLYTVGHWILRRFLDYAWMFIMGCLYIFRGITLLVTTLPSSMIDQCRPPETVRSGTVVERFGYIFTVMGGTALTCTDNIFSGHTCVMMSCVMVWHVHFAASAAAKKIQAFEKYTLPRCNGRYAYDFVHSFSLHYRRTTRYIRNLHYLDRISRLRAKATIAQALETEHSVCDLFADYHRRLYKNNDGAKVYNYLTYQSGNLNSCEEQNAEIELKQVVIDAEL